MLQSAYPVRLPSWSNPGPGG